MLRSLPAAYWSSVCKPDMYNLLKVDSQNNSCKLSTSLNRYTDVMTPS